MPNFRVNEGTSTELYAGSLTGGTIVGIMRLDVGTGATASAWGGTTTTNQNTGTITTGTLQNLVTGTINALASGTITGGTLQNVVGGTLGEVTVVPTVTTVSNVTNGTVRMSVGTITTGSLTDLATVYNLNKGTVTRLETGTLAEVTLVPTVTTVSNLTNGSVRMTVGTMTTGSLTDLATVYNLNKGTVTRLETGTLAEVTLVPTVTTVSNLTNGTVRMSVGTLTTGTLQNLVSGTINALAAGTITNGTVQTIGQRHADEFATVVTSGTSVLGTVKAAVSGSAIYVTGLVISVNAASNVEIASGGTSTPIAGTFFFAGSAGAALMPIDPPLRTASGSALVYKQSANTGLSITAVGYVD